MFDNVSPLSESVNRPDFNSAGVSFSRDGGKMYFTRASLLNNGIESSTIYVSQKSAEGWGVGAELENVNGDWLAMHPVEGELFGTKVLFFVSDMPGGQGGLDIYYSNISGDNIGQPTNLGPSINTKEDEITPFYQDGTLYFSSNGHPTIGGFDIYYATWTGSGWKDVTNIGFNYNSPYDDQFLRFDNTGVNGYMVSNRPNKDKLKMRGNETCCDDIYKINLKELVVGLEALTVDDKGPLKGAVVELYDLTAGGYPDMKTNLNSNNFSFTLETERSYKAVIKKDGYFPDSITFNTVGILDDYTVKKTIKLKADPDWGKKKSETEILTINEPIRLNNIYFDYTKWNILPDAEQDLNAIKDLMNQYPDMVVELGSHTDSRGKDQYNLELSQRRANSTKSWLVKAGIASDRIKAVGYGETVILNQCTNEVQCTDDEHRKNRRSEFKIIAGPQTIEVKKEIFKDQGGEKANENKPKQETPRKQSGKQSFQGTPKITFDKPTLDLGTLKRGEKKEFVIEYTNTGDAPLLVEIITTCKCTSLDYSTRPLEVGEKAVIKAVYDSSNERIGKVEKIIDIIANTNPIVVEVKFSVTVEE